MPVFSLDNDLHGGRHIDRHTAERRPLSFNVSSHVERQIENTPAERSANPHGDERASVPVRHLSAHFEGDTKGSEKHAWGTRMKPVVPMNMFPRRDLLKAGGVLLIGVTIGGAARAQEAEGVAVALGPDQPDPKSLDTWIAIHADNTATIFIGFVELGQGCSTALLQLAAEELDLDMSQVKSIRLESHTMPN